MRLGLDAKYQALGSLIEQLSLHLLATVVFILNTVSYYDLILKDAYQNKMKQQNPGRKLYRKKKGIKSSLNFKI